tara:strand:- start:56 stop:610 length:555 start_codon:yes stop_codon:yes gene_type:complete
MTTITSTGITTTNLTGSNLSVGGSSFTSTDLGGTVQKVEQTVLTGTYSATSNGSEVIVTGVAATITPSSASNKVLLMFCCTFGNHITTYGGYFKRGTTIIGVGDASSSRQRVGMGLGYNGDANQANQASYIFLDSPATTSSTTYQLYLKNDNSVACFFNRSPNDQNNNVGKRGITTITLWEVKP